MSGQASNQQKRWFGIPLDTQRCIDVYLPADTTLEDLEFLVETIEMWKQNFARARRQQDVEIKEPVGCY